MHQAIQFMIADMATDIEASRLLTWKSAVLLDQGQRKHAALLARQALRRRRRDARRDRRGAGLRRLRLHQDYPVEKLMRDAKIMQLYEAPPRSSAS